MHKQENMRIKIKPKNRKDRRAAYVLAAIANDFYNKYQKEFDMIAAEAVIFGWTNDQVTERVRSVMGEPLKSKDK